MSTHPLLTYLETFRLRTGFSQSELAFLMGAIDTKNLRRHERGQRLPCLRAALAYGLILEVSVEDLYEGLLLQVHEDIRARARGLRQHVARRHPTAKNRRKLKLLKRIAECGDLKMK